jgi:hypothetical protein
MIECSEPGSSPRKIGRRAGQLGLREFVRGIDGCHASVYSCEFHHGTIIASTWFIRMTPYSATAVKEVSCRFFSGISHISFFLLSAILAARHRAFTTSIRVRRSTPSRRRHKKEPGRELGGSAEHLLVTPVNGTAPAVRGRAAALYALSAMNRSPQRMERLQNSENGEHKVPERLPSYSAPV